MIGGRLVVNAGGKEILLLIIIRQDYKPLKTTVWPNVTWAEFSRIHLLSCSDTLTVCNSRT